MRILLVTFLLFLSFSAFSQGPVDRIELGYQTTKRGIEWTRPGLPTHVPVFRISRDTNTIIWHDKNTGMRYDWDYLTSVWYARGRFSSALPPLPTQTSGLATIDNRTGFYLNASNILHRYDITQTAWVPLKLTYQSAAPTNVAAGVSNGAAIYTTTLWQDSDDFLIRFWDGDSWELIGGGTDLTFSGASSPVTLNSSTGTDVTFTAGTNISLAATGTNLTINNTGVTSGTGTLNYVPKWTPNGTTFGLSQIFDDGTTIGIGTTPSPYYKMTVAGTGLNSGINVGGLVVGGAPGGSYPLIGYNIRNTATTGLNNYNFADRAVKIGFDNGGVNFSTAVSGTAGNPITWQPRLYVTSGGNVGIGTASPAVKLQVAGNSYFEANSFYDGDFSLGTANQVWAKNGSNTYMRWVTLPDASSTNELQTLANTSNSTSHTATLSNSGGSLQLIEGSGVLLTTGGTGLNGTVTIEAIDPSTTNEIQTYSASGAGPTSYDMTVSSGGTVTLAEGSGINLTRSGNTITVASTAASAWLLDGNTITTAKRIGSNDNFDVVVETNGTDRVWFDNGGTVSIGATQLTTAALNINGLQGGIGQLIAGGSGLVTPSFYQATGSGSGSTAKVFSGIISMLNGNVEALIQNSSTSGTGGVVMQLNAKTATGDPRLYMTIDGTTDWSIGIDNDDVDNLKLHRFAAPSDNNGVGTMEFGYDGTSLGVVINKTGIGTAANAHYGLDVGGKVRGDQFVNNNPTSFTTGTIALGTAAGTGPTLDTGVSEFWGNGGRLKFTSGTSPTANGVICTVTLGTEYTFEECAPIMQGRSTNAGAFNYSCSFNSGTRVITCTLVGTLTASTAYEFNLIVSGHN